MVKLVDIWRKEYLQQESGRKPTMTAGLALAAKYGLAVSLCDTIVDRTPQYVGSTRTVHVCPDRLHRAANLFHEVGHFLTCKDPSVDNYGLGYGPDDTYRKRPTHKNKQAWEERASMMGIFLEKAAGFSPHRTVDLHGWRRIFSGTDERKVLAWLLKNKLITDTLTPTGLTLHGK